MKFCFEVDCNNEESFGFEIQSAKIGQVIEIDAQSSVNDVALFIGSLLAFNNVSLNSEFVDALFKKEELAMSEGLLFEQNEVSIAPGCCADIQDWKDIVECIKNKESPWMGHNPSPWFEFDGESITLWSDEGKDDLTSIKIEQQEFDQQLLDAKKELHVFLEKVEEWAIKNYKQNPSKLVEGIQELLHVKSN